MIFDSYGRILGILGVPDQAHAYLNLELNPLIFRTLIDILETNSSGSNNELTINLYSRARIIETLCNFEHLLSNRFSFQNQKGNFFL